jgi:hypothetical protein
VKRPIPRVAAPVLYTYPRLERIPIEPSLEYA